MKRSIRSACAAGTFAAVLAVAGCGSTSGSSASVASAASTSAVTGAANASCPVTVSDTLAKGIVSRVYQEGVASERVLIARRAIQSSAALREAVNVGDAAAVAAATRAVLKEGPMTNLKIVRGGTTLIDAGPSAIDPVTGTILVSGAPVASYTTTIWSDEGFKAEAEGLTGGVVGIERAGHGVPAALGIGHGHVAPEGTVTRAGTSYAYSSFAGKAFPNGHVRIYLVRPAASASALCGSSHTLTVLNTMRYIAERIYAGESGGRELAQVRRVQHNQPLIEAVEHHDAAAARTAIWGLLNQHIVRLRVITGGRSLADIGAKDAVAPISAPLRANGRTIGTLMLSIQDDEGYKRLLVRLAGLPTVMTLGTEVVKNTLGPLPGRSLPPTEGSYRYKGRTYMIFTLHLRGVPPAHNTTTLSVPVTARVFVPVPYS